MMILQDLPFGANIQTCRMKAGLTQEQLVAQMQIHGSTISRSTLARIETGSRNIKASDLVLIVNILKVKYKDIFES